MRLLKITDFYIKTYLTKGSIIALIVSYIISLIYSLYTILTNYDSYYLNSYLINGNYLDNSFNILNIMLVFIIAFILLKEANLVSDSSNVMLESSFKRGYVYLSKQIAVVSLIFILSTTYFLIFYVPPFFFFNLFKIDFLISFINLEIYLLIISQCFLLINYLFKNYFITLVFAIIIILLALFNNSYISYALPLVKVSDKKFIFDINWYYSIMYLIIIYILNYIVYIKSDRK